MSCHCYVIMSYCVSLCHYVMLFCHVVMSWCYVMFFVMWSCHVIMSYCVSCKFWVQSDVNSFRYSKLGWTETKTNKQADKQTHRLVYRVAAQLKIGRVKCVFHGWPKVIFLPIVIVILKVDDFSDIIDSEKRLILDIFQLKNGWFPTFAF